MYIYEERFQKQGKVVDDPDYVSWLRINHPEVNVIGSYSDTSSASDVISKHSASLCTSDVFK